MQIRELLSESFDTVDRRTARTILTVFVALAVAVPMLGGVAAAQEDGSYSVEQGDECHTVTPVSGDESVEEFYDYGNPDETDNDTNASYKSEGMDDLQEPNSSTVFLYEDDDETVSLVILHGANNTSSTGGAASFNITELPEDGNWTVQDDQYNDSDNHDNWTREGDVHQVHWTWDDKRTDGGAYTGLGDDFSVTIEPAFNEDATLYDEHYNGTVENWTVLSGPRDDPERSELNLSDPVTISAGGCDE